VSYSKKRRRKLLERIAQMNIFSKIRKALDHFSTRDEVVKLAYKGEAIQCSE